MRILGIAGSAAHSGRTRALIDTALEGAASMGEVHTDLLDLSEVTIDFADGRPMEAYSAATRAALDLVRESDGFVIGTPMYRGGMTGALKNLLDVIPKDLMVGKVVGLIATGASHHHYLGMDLGLRTALAFFQAHVVPGILYGAGFQVVDGRPDQEQLAMDARKLGEDVVQMVAALGRRAIGPTLF